MTLLNEIEDAERLQKPLSDASFQQDKIQDRIFHSFSYVMVDSVKINRKLGREEGRGLGSGVDNKGNLKLNQGFYRYMISNLPI